MLKKITYTLTDTLTDKIDDEIRLWFYDRVFSLLLTVTMCAAIGRALNNDYFWIVGLMPVAFMARRTMRKGGAQ